MSYIETHLSLPQANTYTHTMKTGEYLLLQLVTFFVTAKSVAVLHDHNIQC